MSTLRPGESQHRWSQGILSASVLRFPSSYPRIGKIIHRSRPSNIISSDTFWSNPSSRSATHGFCTQEAVRRWELSRWIKCFQGSSLNRQHNSLSQQFRIFSNASLLPPCRRRVGRELLWKGWRVSQCASHGQRWAPESPLPCYVLETNLSF